MTPERWQQVKTVLEQALELPESERPQFLEKSCGADMSLRREVDSLLASSERARSSFLQSPGTTIPMEKGTRLGDYEVGTLLGSGGMGEVYRARDLRLGREVAIKVLPAVFSSDGERLRRFEQEAQAAAALNHPNVLAVFQLGTYGAAPYMVTEFLEGETLRSRLRRGQPGQREAMGYAVQIAHGLAAAHEKGIVHRDLKPENIFLTRDGRAKILDFGLARLMGPERGLDAAGSLETEPGIVMGTIGYMSPEQVRGRPVDHRADIFSFGAVMYEMITGKRAFDKDTPADTMSAILNEDPASMTQFVPASSPALQRIVQRCLEKNEGRRFQSASDLGFALEAITAASELPVVGTARKIQFPRWLAAAGAATLFLAALWFWPRARSGGDNTPLQFSIVLGAGETVGEFDGSSIAFSADGKRLAYVVNHGAERSIYVRDLAQLEGAQVSGSEHGSAPFFSPDGDWLGFVADGKLKKVPVGGGQAQSLCNVAVNVGSTWGGQDTIVYTPNFNAGLYAISANGGAPRRLTTPSISKGEYHLLPEFLPGGRQVLFTVWNGSNTTIDQSRIAVLSMDSGKWEVVMEGGWAGQYAPGHLVFMRGSTLLTIPFDWQRLRVTGHATKIVDGVRRNLFAGAPYYAASHVGSLAYVAGFATAPQRSLVWVSRTGVRTIINKARNPYTAPRVSPDQSRIALWSSNDIIANIFTYDLVRESFRRLTFGADDHTAVWSPDGSQVAFESSREGFHQLYILAADGTGSPVQITTGEADHYLNDWSPDGRYLSYSEWDLEHGSNLWAVPVDHSGRGFALADTPYNEKQAAFSPDGRWIAFTSDESDRSEVYVQPFPGPGAKQQVSTGGGEEPAWAPNGRELFYRAGGQMMSVEVHEEGPRLVTRKAQRLFEGLYNYTVTLSRTYDVARDGRFLMVTEPEGEDAARVINVMVNWQNEAGSGDH